MAKANVKSLVSMADIEKKLAVYATDAARTEESVQTGQFLSIRGGVLSLGGARIKDNKLECVVLDAVMENALFLEQFDPDNPLTPDCFAFGRDTAGMAPHANSPAPQSESCDKCRMNQWGSAALLSYTAKNRAKGKACKNVRRLALLEAGVLSADPGAIGEAQVAYLKIPVTSVANWAGYVKRLEGTFKKPPLAFVTEVSVVPDERSQFQVEFNLVSAITQPAHLQALMARAESQKPLTATPYPVREAKEAAAAAPARKRKF